MPPDRATSYIYHPLIQTSSRTIEPPGMFIIIQTSSRTIEPPALPISYSLNHLHSSSPTDTNILENNSTTCNLYHLLIQFKFKTRQIQQGRMLTVAFSVTLKIDLNEVYNDTQNKQKKPIKWV